MLVMVVVVIQLMQHLVLLTQVLAVAVAVELLLLTSLLHTMELAVLV
jgi:hypothetical protein